MKNTITGRNQSPKAGRHRKWLSLPHFGLWLKPDQRLLWMDNQYPQEQKRLLGDSTVSPPFFFFCPDASNPNRSSNRKRAPRLSQWSQNCRLPQNNVWTAKSRSQTKERRALLQTGDRRFPSISSALSPSCLCSSCVCSNPLPFCVDVLLLCGAPPLWMWLSFCYQVRNTAQRGFSLSSLPLTHCHQFIGASPFSLLSLQQFRNTIFFSFVFALYFFPYLNTAISLPVNMKLAFKNPTFFSDHSCIFITIWSATRCAGNGDGDLPLGGRVLAGQVMEGQGSDVCFLLISDCNSIDKTIRTSQTEI